MISTREYQDRLDTLGRVRNAGLKVCCGGIVGMGESRLQRAGLIAQLASLGMKVESYGLDVGTPPANLQQLVTKPANSSGWAGPYAKPSDLKDPFGHPFGYRYPGEHGSFDLIFFGQDGQPGGEGYKADLGNWE